MNKASVLCVEDDPTIQMLLQGALSIDCDITIAGRGDKALQIAAEKKPDIIILDVGLPDMTGYEVCRRIKSDPALKHIPILFLTSMDSVEKELRGLEAGGIDYIAKPINVLVLRARLKNHIADLQARARKT